MIITTVPIAMLTRRPSLSPTKAEASAPKKAPTWCHVRSLQLVPTPGHIPSKIATMTETIVCDGSSKVLLKALVVTLLFKSERHESESRR